MHTGGRKREDCQLQTSYSTMTATDVSTIPWQPCRNCLESGSQCVFTPHAERRRARPPPHAYTSPGRAIPNVLPALAEQLEFFSSAPSVDVAVPFQSTQGGTTTPDSGLGQFRTSVPSLLHLHKGNEPAALSISTGSADPRSQAQAAEPTFAALTSSESPSASTHDSDGDYLDDESEQGAAYRVAYVTLDAAAEPHYVGPSSGFTWSSMSACCGLGASMALTRPGCSTQWVAGWRQKLHARQQKRSSVIVESPRRSYRSSQGSTAVSGDSFDPVRNCIPPYPAPLSFHGLDSDTRPLAES